jgi:hypothetical protein
MTKIGLYIFLIYIVSAIIMGLVIDKIANSYDFPDSDGYTPIPYALLGLVWPVSFLPFIIICFVHKARKGKI